MKKFSRTFLQMLKRRDGMNAVVVALAGICAIVLLAFFVQTLHDAIARGDALREQQRRALHTTATQVLAIDIQVSDARIDATR